ncbi:hypothetical protein C8R44DRAFT_726268 [Mycena epipterygia]|nr:hypothetical protein C8R44DRAFT_726268 [Mycena epipterygia]
MVVLLVLLFLLILLLAVVFLVWIRRDRSRHAVKMLDVEEAGVQEQATQTFPAQGGTMGSSGAGLLHLWARRRIPAELQGHHTDLLPELEADRERNATLMTRIRELEIQRPPYRPNSSEVPEYTA